MRDVSLGSEPWKSEPWEVSLGKMSLGEMGFGKKSTYTSGK